MDAPRRLPFCRHTLSTLSRISISSRSAPSEYAALFFLGGPLRFSEIIAFVMESRRGESGCCCWYASCGGGVAGEKLAQSDWRDLADALGGNHLQCPRLRERTRPQQSSHWTCGGLRHRRLPPRLTKGSLGARRSAALRSWYRSTIFKCCGRNVRPFPARPGPCAAAAHGLRSGIRPKRAARTACAPAPGSPRSGRAS